MAACDIHGCYSTIRAHCAYDQVGSYPGKSDKERCSNCIMSNSDAIWKGCDQEACAGVVNNYCQHPPSLLKHWMWVIGMILFIALIIFLAYHAGQRPIRTKKKMNPASDKVYLQQ